MNIDIDPRAIKLAEEMSGITADQARQINPFIAELPFRETASGDQFTYAVANELPEGAKAFCSALTSNLICPVCHCDSGIPDEWGSSGCRKKCANCGARLAVHSDETYDSETGEEEAWYYVEEDDEDE